MASVTRQGTQATTSRDRILDAAVDCIDDLGIARASSNEIARRAGMTWGSIQHHFGSRDQLLLAVIARNFTELDARVRGAQVGPGSLLDRLQSLADLLWSYCSDRRYRATVEILLDMRRDPGAAAHIEQRLAETDRAMNALWDAHFEAVLGAPLDRTLERILFGAMRGFALARHMNTMHGDFTQERAVLVRLLAQAATVEGFAVSAGDPNPTQRS